MTYYYLETTHTSKGIVIKVNAFKAYYYRSYQQETYPKKEVSEKLLLVKFDERFKREKAQEVKFNSFHYLNIQVLRVFFVYSLIISPNTTSNYNEDGHAIQKNQIKSNIINISFELLLLYS